MATSSTRTELSHEKVARREERRAIATDSSKLHTYGYPDTVKGLNGLQYSAANKGKAAGNMSKTDHESTAFSQLRVRAEAHLKAGTTPPSTNWALGADALRMLHRLSSNPDTAQDALKLLHELQVHQVELDVQHEEIVANESVLLEDLSRYRALFDYAPAGYFLLDRDGIVVAGNLAAAELFGLARENLGGHRIDTILDQEFRPQLQDLLQRVAQNEGRASCTVQMKSDSSEATLLQFAAAILPGSECILLTCSVGTPVG